MTQLARAHTHTHLFCLIRVTVGAGVPAVTGQEALESLPGQGYTPLTHNQAHFGVSNQPNVYAFGLWQAQEHAHQIQELVLMGWKH